jgi:prepilin-type N-terminal cleavage/methylation domain-containing protein
MRKLLKTVRKIYRRGLGEKGFTLIELLVVVGILAALAGVVTLSVGQFIGKGKTEACQTDQHNVQTAVVAFMADNNGTPPTDVTAVIDGGYLLDSPKGTYTINQTTGEVTQDSCP